MEFSSWWGALWTLGNPNNRVSTAYFLHLSSSLLHLPLGLILKPQSMKPPAGGSLKPWLKSDIPGPHPQTYKMRISQEETKKTTFKQTLPVSLKDKMLEPLSTFCKAIGGTQLTQPQHSY